MLDWSAYEARLGVNGTSGRERALARASEAVNRKSASSPALKRVSVAGEELDIFMHSTDNANIRKFDTLPGGILRAGSVVDYKDSHWLVTESDIDDDFAVSGELIRCNKQIRWQNKKTYKIIERWCVFNSSASFKIDENSTLSTSDKEYKLWLPFDEETRLIDLPFRIMPDVIDGNPRTYECSGVDQNTKTYQGIDGGVLVLRFTQDGAGLPADRVDLMVCDYVEPPDTPDPSPDLLKCEISGRSNIRIGIPRKYYPVFYAGDGTTMVDGVTPVWTVTAPEGYEDKVTWATNDGFIEITITNDSMIGKKIAVRLVDDGGLYSPAELIVEVVDTV